MKGNNILPEDHPRLRGEHYKVLSLCFWVVGSPPPTRGTQKTPDVVDKTPGITPAYAGNTDLESLVYQKIEDHPRLRGEHYYIF